MNKLIKIAHRGFSNKEIENTMEAFNNAIKYKFDMIELDIRLCASNDLVIYHDPSIKKNNNIFFIKDLSYEELLNINPNIITLPIFFQHIDKSKIKINIDIKGETKIVKYLLEFLDNKFSDFDNIILTSFNLNIVHEIINFNKNYPCKYINKGFITENIFDLNTLDIILKNIEYLIIYWNNLNYDIIDYCHKNDKKIFCYTCTNLLEYKYIKKFDIDGIISDVYLI